MAFFGGIIEKGESSRTKNFEVSYDVTNVPRATARRSS